MILHASRSLVSPASPAVSKSFPNSSLVLKLKFTWTVDVGLDIPTYYSFLGVFH